MKYKICQTPEGYFIKRKSWYGIYRIASWAMVDYSNDRDAPRLYDTIENALAAVNELYKDYIKCFPERSVISEYKLTL